MISKESLCDNGVVDICMQIRNILHGAYSIEDAELREAVCKVFMNCERRAITVLQSKRANFVVFKVFCYIHRSIQEGSILSLWEGTTSTCTALWEVTCCHVTQVCHYGFI